MTLHSGPCRAFFSRAQRCTGNAIDPRALGPAGNECEQRAPRCTTNRVGRGQFTAAGNHISTLLLPMQISQRSLGPLTRTGRFRPLLRKQPNAHPLTTGTRNSTVATALANGALSLQGVRSAILWYKSDLRVDDHAGLLAASSASELTPVYVLDPAALSHLQSAPAGPEVLVAALTSLRSQLRALGSDLVIRTGPCRGALRALAVETGAGAILSAEDMPQSAWLWHGMDSAMREEGRGGDASASPAGSSSPLQDGSVISMTWSEEAAWDAARFDLNYRTWVLGRGACSAPLPPPSSLPPLPEGVPMGDIPSVQELRALLRSPIASAAAMSADESVASISMSIEDEAAASPEASLLTALAMARLDPQQMLEAYLSVSGSSSSSSSGTSLDSDDEALLQIVALAAAGSGLSASGTSDIAALIGAAAEALERPSAPGASFKALLGPWLELGALSRRRVLAQAARTDAGMLPLRAAAAARAAELSEFHTLLSTEGAGKGRPREMMADGEAVGGISVRQFRWRGMLNEFCIAEPAQPRPGAPALLLVHGFGAFGDQWRRNMAALASAGYRVFAPTLPGFGRSEKAAVPYSQDMWRDYLRDFTLQVVGGRVVVVGNSIGGFIAASMAADYPQITSGLILLNSAGKIDTNFSMAAWRKACELKKPLPRFVVEAVSKSLFWFLERTIPGTLKWLYITNPDKADEWLAEEIYRAACDPGSLEVFMSVFYLPPPRALNYLIATLFRGPTLVLQGALDPLNDARSRAEAIRASCPDNVEVVLLQAGHCPHDEQPEMVNQGILNFLEQKVMRQMEATTLLNPAVLV